RVVEGEIPEQYRAEALEGEATRVMLEAQAPEELDWLFISPAGGYGSFAPGERTGTYRVGDEIALFDADGDSNMSGADFALAIVDEIENPRHHREHISIAY
ncbi:MAG: NAD-dependent epimerase, partial [Tetrasphaera sp.]|nr:NAD-dependent epimerase [Tetrasphaera sp.]